MIEVKKESLELKQVKAEIPYFNQTINERYSEEKLEDNAKINPLN